MKIIPIKTQFIVCSFLLFLNAADSYWNFCKNLKIHLLIIFVYIFRKSPWISLLAECTACMTSCMMRHYFLYGPHRILTRLESRPSSLTLTVRHLLLLLDLPILLIMLQNSGLNLFCTLIGSNKT